MVQLRPTWEEIALLYHVALTAPEATMLVEALYSSKTSSYSSAQLEVLSELLKKLDDKSGEGASKVTLALPTTEKACKACNQVLPASAFYLYRCKEQVRYYSQCKRCTLAVAKQKQQQRAATNALNIRPQLPSELASVKIHLISKKELIDAQQILQRRR